MSCGGDNANLEDDDGRNMSHWEGSAAKGEMTVTEGNHQGGSLLLSIVFGESCVLLYGTVWRTLGRNGKG